MKVDNLKGVGMRVTVTLTKRLKLRLAVGMWLIRLGARVMGCALDMTTEQTNKEAE